MEIIGIDTGNRCIKTANKVFVAGLKELEANSAFQHEALTINNKSYMLSQNRITYLQDKTLSEQYFILSLFGIVKELEHRGAISNSTIPIQLGIGLPPSHISLYKDKFKKYFDRGIVSFSYGPYENITLDIKDIYVFSQGYAAIFMDYENIRKYDKSYIIDIGGYTTDVIALNNGLIDPDFCESLDYGLIHLLNQITWKIKKKYGRCPTETQLDKVINTGKELLSDMPILEIVNNETVSYLDDIMRKLLEFKIDLKFSKGIFVGGGSERLKPWIEKSDFVNEPYFVLNVHANAQGYEQIIKSINSRK